MKQSHFSMKLLTTCETVAYKEVIIMEDRNNKTCSELIRDKLNERIADFKQALKSYEENNYEKIVTEDGDEYENVIDQIVYYSLEIMEKILENTQE
jgi:hypothetical protein